MPRKIVKKIFKAKRKAINDDRNNFVIRFKGKWSSAELKELRLALDGACAGVMEDLDKPEEKDEY